MKERKDPIFLYLNTGKIDFSSKFATEADWESASHEVTRSTLPIPSYMITRMGASVSMWIETPLTASQASKWRAGEQKSETRAVASLT